MQPLHQLLHRIKWDAEFARGEFALGYHDRVARKERIVPFSAVSVEAAADSFSCEDEDGRVVKVPLHRVRTVYKDGVVIWQRPRQAAGD